MELWLEQRLRRVSRGVTVAEDIRYGLSQQGDDYIIRTPMNKGVKVSPNCPDCVILRKGCFANTLSG